MRILKAKSKGPERRTESEELLEGEALTIDERVASKKSQAKKGKSRASRGVAGGQVK